MRKSMRHFLANNKGINGVLLNKIKYLENTPNSNIGRILND